MPEEELLEQPTPETDSNLESILEANLLVADQTKEAVKDLEKPLEAIMVSTDDTKNAVKDLEPLLDILVSVTNQSAEKIEVALQKFVEDHKSLIDETPEVFNKLTEQLKEVFASIKSSHKTSDTHITDGLKRLEDLIAKLPTEYPKGIDLEPVLTELKALSAKLTTLEPFQLPLDEDRVAVKLSEEDMRKIRSIYGGVEVVGVKNSDDTRINPATEEKQDAIITAIGAISGGGVDPVGLKNTSAVAINPATEDTLALLLTQLTAINANTDNLEGFTDGIEASLTTLQGYVDGVEALLTTINTNIDGLEGFTDGIEAALTTIQGFIDGVEGFVDGLETLVTSTNTKLDTVIGHVDGIEALLTTIDADTGSILLAVDGIEAQLTTITGHVDGIETLITSTNTKLDIIIGHVDGIEGLLTTAVASLSVLDDWDESDRAKVNLIVGQAGITGGAGAVAANTPRVTHASDDPVVTALQIMDDWDDGTDRAKVTSQFQLNSTARTTQASIDFASSGDNTIVSATASQTTRVHKIFLVVAADTVLTFKNGATGLTGAITMKAGGSITLDFDAEPWFITSANTAFIINSSVATQVSGRIYYTKSA